MHYIIFEYLLIKAVDPCTHLLYWSMLSILRGISLGSIVRNSLVWRHKYWENPCVVALRYRKNETFFIFALVNRNAIAHRATFLSQPICVTAHTYFRCFISLRRRNATTHCESQLSVTIALRPFYTSMRFPCVCDCVAIRHNAWNTDIC